MENSKVDWVGYAVEKPLAAEPTWGPEGGAGQECMPRKLPMEDLLNRGCKGLLGPLGVCGGTAGGKPLGCGCSTVLSYKAKGTAERPGGGPVGREVQGAATLPSAGGGGLGNTWKRERELKQEAQAPASSIPVADWNLGK